MNPPKWFLVLPPEGAARQVGLDLQAAAQAAPEGATLKVFDTRIYLEGFDRLLKQADDDMRVDLMNQSLVVAALDHGATHVLVMALAPVTVFTLQLLRRQGLRLYHWFIEDFRQAAYWSQVLPAYHGFYALQAAAVAAACEKQGTHFALLPTAMSPALAHRPVNPAGERDLDFAFVGLPSPYRLAVLDALRAAGARLAVGGTGWHQVTGPLRACVTPGRAVDGSLAPHEAFAVLERAVFGLHIPYEDPGIDRANSHVSPRLYDVLALGCLPFCEEGPLLRDALQGYEVTWFRGPQGAAQAWQGSRQAAQTGWDRIVTANRQRVLGQDTYAHRWSAWAHLGA